MTRRSKPFTRRDLLTFIVAATFVGVPSALAQTPSNSIVDALRKGGYVIYFRHAATTWSGIDRIEWPREKQRLLSKKGIEQSKLIGKAFNQAGIPVGEVLASPFARCRDMAEIAFGRVEERSELLGLLSDDDGKASRVDYLRSKATSLPAPGKNRVIVSHRSNIREVAGVALAEGEAVVVRPTGSGFRIVGQLMPEDWSM